MKNITTLMAIFVSFPVAALAGCISVQPASVSRGESAVLSFSQPEPQSGASHQTPRTSAVQTSPQPDPIIWPARWGDNAQGIANSLGKGVIVPIEGPRSAWFPVRHGPWHTRLPKGDDKNIVATLAQGRTNQAGYAFRMEGNGAYVFDRDPDTPAIDPTAPPGRAEPAFMFLFASGREATATQSDARQHIEIERTWFAYYDHRRDGAPDPADPGVGTIALLPGLFGIPEQVVDVVTSTMRQRGWNVIRMLAPPARFVESTELELDPTDADSPRKAAQELMNRIAESAYAVEAAWQYVEQQRPATKDIPHLVFGGSGGGLALPAVVARDPARYDGAVIVAGGANILDVVSRSTYTKPVDALDFAWKGYDDAVPPTKVLDAFTTQYLAHATLDGYHAAGWMSDLPTLIVQARGDKAVPVEASELLWQRLGEPEKWTMNGNHLTLFLSLWFHTPRILDWAQTNVVQPAAGGKPPQSDDSP